MGYCKRIVLGFLKDKGSLIKTSLSTKRHKSAVHRVILRATTHKSSAPPSDHRLATVIALGEGSTYAASAGVQALMDRLNRTSDAWVALKCLFLIHNILVKGSVLLKDQLSVYPCFGGRNFLNLSMFRDDSDSETLELSTWVRWYAGILEQNLIVSRVLGYHLNSSRAANKNKIWSLSNSDLLTQIDSLVDFADHVGNPPESLYLQRKNLVYEVVRSVSENYRLVQREISVRVTELRGRMMSMSFSESTAFLNSLKRFEDCKESISLLLVNRNRNDDLRDLMKETKANLVVMMKDKNMLLITMGDEDDDSSKLFRLASGRKWVVGF
ncbi:ENTH/ANTH/VHS superfamily protein [Corchorus capsularis]|uniref:ENTH/ANTH/VHS superfamily protein n=1 Tax=Corchorus capsularis TaxID=210143 RepID=A0A1R3JP47_COCAP|nr:ENTH/ANTH/VHS superfamily protein [Corchorus capsularis]